MLVCVTFTNCMQVRLMTFCAFFSSPTGLKLSVSWASLITMAIICSFFVHSKTFSLNINEIIRCRHPVSTKRPLLSYLKWVSAPVACFTDIQHRRRCRGFCETAGCNAGYVPRSKWDLYGAQFGWLLIEWGPISQNTGKSSLADGSCFVVDDPLADCVPCDRFVQSLLTRYCFCQRFTQSASVESQESDAPGVSPMNKKGPPPGDQEKRRTTAKVFTQLR